MENRIFRKSISFDRKIKALTQKLFYVSIFTSNHFRTQTLKERERESLWLRATKHTGKIAPQPQMCRRDRIVNFMPPRSSCRDRATWSLLSLDRSRLPLGQIISSFGSISSFATRRSITCKYFTPWKYFTLKQTQPTTLTNLTGVCWHLPSSIVKIFFASKGYETLMRYKRN